MSEGDDRQEPRLNQITLGVSDVGRAVAFYRGLGLIPIVEVEHYARMVAPGNGVTLSVHRDDGPGGSDATVYLECDALDDTVHRLESSGYRFDEPPADRRWLWREARLRDPDGNPLCLYRAGDARLNPPWRLPSSRDRHVLSRERFRAWLDRYARAWIEGDPRSFAALFSENATFHPNPFDPPAEGRAAIAVHWREEVAGQRDPHCTFDVLDVADVTGRAHGKAGYAREPGGTRVRLDGIVEVDFDAEGVATRLRGWWHARDVR